MKNFTNDSEIKENRLAANKILVFFPLGIVAYLMNLTGFYHINQDIFSIAFSFILLSILLVQLFGRIPSLARNRHSKYIIVMLTFVLTLSTLALLNFHVILMLSLPMIVAKNIALYHHEKYDGTGYPKGLKGDDIPLEARIMAIADVYDALVSERCYKSPMTHEEAFDIIKQEMGTHFDPRLWSCFEKAYPQIKQFYS